MKNNLLKKLVYVVAIILVIIQFIRPAKNEGEALGPQDISKAVSVSDTVMQILKTSCFDCHSNRTQYPWYTYIQPLGFWTTHHVNEGKEELNFSEFASYTAKRQMKKFKEMGEQLKEKEMPLFSYTIIHRNAVLTPEQITILNSWINTNMGQNTSPAGSNTESEEKGEEQDGD